MKPLLTYVEDCLPAATLRGRLELAEENGLALEVALRRGRDPSPLFGAGIRIVTLQAYDMHELHPLHPDASRRRQAVAYVNETIDVAAENDVPRVLTASGFGDTACAEPFESCVSFYSGVVEHARKRGVRVLIELLSPRRAPAMTDPADLLRLVDALGAPDTIGVALDLGHLADAGLDLGGFLRTWPVAVEELQLRGAGSRPPATRFDLAGMLQWLPEPPAVVCVEHREPIARAEFARLVGHLRKELWDVRQA